MTEEERTNWEFEIVQKAIERWKQKYPGLQADELLDQCHNDDGSYYQNWDAPTDAAANDYDELKNLVIMWELDGSIKVELQTRQAYLLESYDSRTDQFESYPRRRWNLEDRQRLKQFLIEELDGGPINKETGQWLERCIKSLTC